MTVLEYQIFHALVLFYTIDGSDLCAPIVGGRFKLADTAFG